MEPSTDSNPLAPVQNAAETITVPSGVDTPGTQFTSFYFKSRTLKLLNRTRNV